MVYLTFFHMELCPCWWKERLNQAGVWIRLYSAAPALLDPAFCTGLCLTEDKDTCIQALALPPQKTSKRPEDQIACICVIQWCQFQVTLLFLCSMDEKGQLRFISLIKYGFRLILDSNTSYSILHGWKGKTADSFLFKHWCWLRVTFLFLCLLDGTGHQPIRFIYNQKLVSREFNTSFSLLTG